MTSLLIKNGQILGTYHELTQSDILIRDGRIAELAPRLVVKADQTIDVAGKFVTPGLIDIHVHFREPGFEYKETIGTGSTAAARGGFTTVAAMPNLNPVPNTVPTFDMIQARNAEAGVVHIEQYGAISQDLTGEVVNDIVGLAQAGAIAFTNDGKGVQNASTMKDAMVAAAAVNKPLVAHLEDESLMKDGVMNLGIRSAELGLPGIDPLAESSQLARDLVLAEATGVHYHVAHLSTKTSVELVRMAKARGVKVTAEVSPHHLLLDETQIPSDNAIFKMNPPLRTPSDREAVLGGLLDGTIDMIATDHAPHAVDEKERGFVGAAFGITGIETSFQLMYTHLVKPGIMSLDTLIERMVVAPQRVFQLHEAPTRLTVGAVADLAVFDLTTAHTISATEFASKGVNSPFIGWEIYGQTALTLVDGNIVYEA